MTALYIYLAGLVLFAVGDRLLVRGPCETCGTARCRHADKWGLTAVIAAAWPFVFVAVIAMTVWKLARARGLR